MFPAGITGLMKHTLSFDHKTQFQKIPAAGLIMPGAVESIIPRQISKRAPSASAIRKPSLLI